MSSPMLLQQLHDAIVQNNFAYIDSNIHSLPINLPLTNQKETAMHICAGSNQTEIMTLLLRHGVLVNCRDLYGNTPLHSACFTGAYEAAQLLTKSGAAAIDATSKRGMTALMVAVWYRYHDLVALLLASGAAISVVSQDGAQVLHYAALTGDESLMALVAAKSKKHTTAHGLSWQDMVRLQGQHWHLLTEAEQAELNRSQIRLSLLNGVDGMPELVFSEAEETSNGVADAAQATGANLSTQSHANHRLQDATGTVPAVDATSDTTHSDVAEATAVNRFVDNVDVGNSMHAQTVNDNSVVNGHSAATDQYNSAQDNVNAVAEDTAFGTAPVIAAAGEGSVLTSATLVVTDDAASEVAFTAAPDIVTTMVDAPASDTPTDEFTIIGDRTSADVDDDDMLDSIHVQSSTANEQEENEQYSFDQSELRHTVDAIASRNTAEQAIAEHRESEQTQPEPQLATTAPEATYIDPVITDTNMSGNDLNALNESLYSADSFDISRGLFRSISGMYTNNAMVLTISNLLAALEMPHQTDRSMQGTVTPGERTPSFSFFDRNGNVVVWEVLEYDPFEDNNVSTWNETKLWYQNNGFSYDVNFFMSHANHDAIDSKEIYETAQSIKQQM